MDQARSHPLIIIVAADRVTQYGEAAAEFDRAQTDAYEREEAQGEVPASIWEDMTEVAEQLAGEVVHLFTGATTWVITEHTDPAGNRCPWSQAAVDADAYPYPHGRCPHGCAASASITQGE